MKRLFITDLDGTLLGSDSRVSARSASIISRLTDRGALITVATARTPATVQNLLADTRIALPAIVFTGAAEWDLSRQTYTTTAMLDDATSDEIEATIRRAGITPFRYTLGADGIINTYYIGSCPSAAEQKFIDERSALRLKHMHINDPEHTNVPRDCTLMFFAIAPAEAIFAAADRLRERGDCSVSCYRDIFYPSVALLEVFAAGVSKAAAVRRLADRIGADHVTVFGDNLNDLPMMEVADTAVAVDNAAPEVKAAADIVIGPNTADSVARYIEKCCGASEEGAEDVEGAE